MKGKASKNFEEIYNTESDSIFRFCLIKVSNREQALDLTQETFLRLWQNLLQNKEIENTRAFLFTVARNLIIDWYRKKKSISLEKILETKENHEDADILDDNTITENLFLEADGRHFLSMISKLEKIHQEPVYLRFVEDLSPPEIGKILGITTNAASVRINRGLIELRKITVGKNYGN